MANVLFQPDGEINASGPVRHSEAAWAEHKPLLLHLFLVAKKTTKEVQHHMTSCWHFNASLQQYQRQFKKWGVEKNKPQERWTRLPRLLKRKQVDVDHAEIWDGGVVQDRKRVKKYLSRNNPPNLGDQYRFSSNHLSSCGDHTAETPTTSCTDDNMFVRVALTPRLELSTPTTLPWFEFVRSCPPRPTHSAVVSDQPAHGTSHGVVYDPETTVNPEDLPLTEVANLSSTQHSIGNRSTQASHSSKCLISSSTHPHISDSRLQQTSRAEMESKILLEAIMPAEIPGDIHVDPTALLRAPANNSVANGMACHFYIISNILCDKIKTKLDLLPIFKIPGLLSFILKSSEPLAKALTQHLLKAAIDWRDHELLETLRTHGVDFNMPIPDYEPVTPIQYIIGKAGDGQTVSRARVLELLLESGADPDHCWKHRTSKRLGQSACCHMLPIVRATSYSYGGTMMDMLVAAGCTIPDNVDITTAISRGVSIDTLEALLSHMLVQRSWSSRISLGENLYPLQAAVARFDEEMVAVVLAHHECPSGRADTEIHYHLHLQAQIFDASSYDMEGLVNVIRTPLASAYLGYKRKIVGMLLDAGADVNHCHASALAPYINLGSISSTSVVDDRDASTHALVLSAVQAAVFTQDLLCVETILRMWVPTHSCHGTPPIVLAVLTGNLALVELLLRHGADVCETEDDNVLHSSERRRFSALGAAAAVGSISMMEVLIEAGADINQPASGPGVLSPLQAAVYFRQHDSVLFLCQAGADASLAGAEKDGLTAIEAAIHVEDHWAFELLCQRCLPTQSSLVLAAELQDDRFWNTLIGTGCNINDPDIIKASVSDENRFFRLLEAGLLQLAMPFQNKTLADVAFTAAVDCGNIRIMRYISDTGYVVCEETIIESCKGPIKNPEWFPEYARSFVAAKPSYEAGSRFPSVAFLFQHLLPNPKTDEMYATFLYSAIQTLLEDGSDVNAHYKHKTPLQYAVESRLYRISQLLIDNGADANLLPSASCDAALHSACIQGNIAMVALLLKHGADTNGSTAYHWLFSGYTALQIACKEGHVEIACMLIQHGASINAPASDLKSGRTALQAACEAGHVEMVNLLINNHADINAPAGPKMGVTALQAAAIEGFFRIVQILIAAGADVAAPASAWEGRTAIDGAAERGRLDIVHYLLDLYEGEESISAICDRARTYAWKEGHLGVVRLLDTYQRRPA